MLSCALPPQLLGLSAFENAILVIVLSVVGRVQRLFDVWLWKSFYQNPHMFPTLGCLINMVRIKQLVVESLWLLL